MKRILIALAVLLSLQIANAQVKSPADAKKAVEAAEEAAQNPKKATKVATWLKLAAAYMDAYNSPAGNAWVGAGQQELKLVMGNVQPVSVETVELSGDVFTKEVYENNNLYFNRNGVLAMIEVTKPVYDDALAKALDAYQKAYSVDVKQSKIKDITEGIKGIGTKYLDEGMTKYMLGDLKSASSKFESAANAVAADPVNGLDTIAVYNAGFTAWMSQDYQRASGFFIKCAEAKYYEGGETFAKLSDCYDKLGDKEKAKLVLEEGFSAFPQSQSILIGLINFYLESGDDPDRLFVLLDEAKKNEPNNASLYYVEGNIYSELGQKDKALESYAKCAEINPEYEYGYIGAGIMLYNDAIDIQEKAQEELDDAKYLALVDEFEKCLMDAISPFENAYNLTKSDDIKLNIAEYLKNIYYRFRDKDPKYEEGYNKYNEISKSGVIQ